MIELSGEKVILNGLVTSIARANSIMFVQCTILGKAFDINVETDPIAITISDYTPTEADMKPDAEIVTVRATPAGENIDMTPHVRKCGSCGDKKTE